jgi:tRNA 2-thiouridine synthesizing protein D
MIYSLLVLASPATGTGNLTAARFAQAVLQSGHSLDRVFFYDAGVETGLVSRIVPQDEDDPAKLWRELASKHGVELVVCVASALRRGVLDANEARRHEKAHPTLDPAFCVGGLGLLIESAATADRLITFGSA